MKRRLMTILSAGILLVTVACSDNYRAKHMGGTMTMQLPKGQRLVNVTWKEGELWYLTRPRAADEQPVTWTFKEKSTMGIQEGAVVLQEQ